MPRIRVTLSANAGICVEAGGKKVLVDLVHEDKQLGFSNVTDSLFQRILQEKAFSDGDCLCYTHCHGDHYSRGMTAEFFGRWPRMKLFLPEPEFENQILVSGSEFLWEEDGLKLRFLRLPHEGAAGEKVSHYGLIITAGGVNILISGDCATASPDLARILENIRVDLAVLAFPWAALKKGREFLRQNLGGAHILLYHLPFAEDDICGYRSSASRAAENLRESRDVRLLTQPLQSETVNI